jgi:3-hydroxyacyl-[acyl-carrier-protein] dehydratase
MRWFWFDRFLEFESGRRARSIKNVTLAENHLHDHFPGAPRLPNSLVTEGIAQTGGLLVGEVNQFAERVVLAKISRIKFTFDAVPGDSLIYETLIEDIHKDGAMIKATAHVGDRLQCEAELFFAHLGGRHNGRELFDPADFLVTLRTLGLYDVGRKPDGTPLEPPPSLLAAERAAANTAQ